MNDYSRRGFIAAAGGALAAAWLTADVPKLLATADDAARAGRENPPPPFQFLTAAQAADLDAATAQIMPSDDTPGAREAHVVYFIDRSLATWNKEQRPDFTKGLAELAKRAGAASGGNGSPKSFATLTSDQQRDVIASLEKDQHPFFFALRGATIAGMFSNPEYGGNFRKQGWKLLGFNDQFSWAAPFGWYDANA
jgi:gluconate 2-dehydrogenase gamma chain